MATYAQTAGKSIKSSFDEFHKNNPRIYSFFKKYAFYMIREKNMSKISSKLIINRIRWEVFVETTSEDYRINDAFTAHYARIFIAEFPEYAGKFELRELRAYQSDELPFI